MYFTILYPVIKTKIVTNESISIKSRNIVLDSNE